MSARPARAIPQPELRRPRIDYDDPRRAARLEARRRVRHLRRRRRDLLEDFGVALFVMLMVLILTPGLGVVALLSGAVAFLLIGTVVAERMIRKRRL